MIFNFIHFVLGMIIFFLVKILSVVGIYVFADESQTEEEEHLHITFNIHWLQLIVSIIFLPISSYGFYKLFEFILNTYK